ncbi:hypothetical protein UK12_35085 [Saccharothrix sp. ST-888]|nr:hypothetical protein UK12_35085 [Saccharothrix sp. ST-888]
METFEQPGAAPWRVERGSRTQVQRSAQGGGPPHGAGRGGVAAGMMAQVGAKVGARRTRPTR